MDFSDQNQPLRALSLFFFFSLMLIKTCKMFSVRFLFPLKIMQFKIDLRLVLIKLNIHFLLSFQRTEEEEKTFGLKFQTSDRQV